MAEQQIILVAESNTSSRLAGILRTQGHQVHTMGSGGPRTAAYIDAHLTVLIVLAAQLPEMSGFEMCRRPKQRDRTRHIPVLLITENLQQEAEALQAGASDFLSASLRPAEVLARVQAH